MQSGERSSYARVAPTTIYTYGRGQVINNNDNQTNRRKKQYHIKPNSTYNYLPTALLLCTTTTIIIIRRFSGHLQVYILIRFLFRTA